MSEEPAVRDRDLLRRIYGETRGYRLHIVGIFVISLIATPLALLGPIPLKIAVDSVLGSEPVPAILKPAVPGWFQSTEFRLLLFAAGLQVLIVLLGHLQSMGKYLLETYTGEKLTLRFRAALLGHAQRLSFAFHDARGSADSIYRIQWDAPAIQYVAVYGFIPFVSSIVTLAAMIYVILRLDAQLALVALAISPFLFQTARWFKLRMTPHYRHTKQLESSALKVIQEVLVSLRVIVAFGREAGEEQRFSEVSTKGLRARVKIATAESLFGLVVSLITATGTALVLFLGVRSVQSGRLTIGELLVVLAYLSQLYGPLKTLSRKVASLQKHFVSAHRAFELLDEVPDVVERKGAQSLVRSRGDIEFRRVSYAYEGGNPALSDVSFQVSPGRKLGIAGPTGAGKTTLVSLLSRFYDVSEGEILLDGVDVRDIRLKDLRSQFAIMLQEPVLFSTSIAENIAYARPESTFGEVIRAAETAGAHEFILELPDGYETVVGERGMRLSGGERQRVSLARAFLKDAPILILDEPTSSVDVKTEEGIMEAMDKLMVGRTTLMIAHRSSTLHGCDAILAFGAGGSHDETRSPDRGVNA